MKRDKRVWAGVLAAAVLWLVSVCAGSDDLSAAAEAVLVSADAEAVQALSLHIRSI